MSERRYINLRDLEYLIDGELMYISDCLTHCKATFRELLLEGEHRALKKLFEALDEMSVSENEIVKGMEEEQELGS